MLEERRGDEAPASQDGGTKRATQRNPLIGAGRTRLAMDDIGIGVYEVASRPAWPHRLSGQSGPILSQPDLVSAAIPRLRLPAALALAIVQDLHLQPRERPATAVRRRRVLGDQ